MSTVSTRNYVGTSVRRVEDDRILTGRGRYIDDFDAAGAVHAVFVRSPFAHARVVSIDVEQARAIPGVVAVITGAELAAATAPMGLTFAPPGQVTAPFTALATDKVRFVGDPVAVILAETRHLAEDASSAVDVEYEQLAAVMTAEQARDRSLPNICEETGTNLIYHGQEVNGDPDAEFAAAHKVVRHRIRLPRVAHVPMEGRGGLAEYDAGTRTLVYRTATQSPAAVRTGLARALRHPLDRLHVVTPPDIGGAFGQKGFLAREDVAVCHAAKQLARPVKWIEDRGENLGASLHGRGETMELAAAVDSDGGIHALEVEVDLNQGAYPATYAVAFLARALCMLLPSSYRIEHFRWRASVLATNMTPFSPYRGPWMIETLARETLIDLIANELELDPIDVRRRNLVPMSEQPFSMCCGSTLEGASTLESMERAAKVAGYDALRMQQAQAREQGRLLGIGIACFIEPAPGPPDFAAAVGFPRHRDRAIAQLELGGHVIVHTTQSPHGQGHETTLAQVAASELGVPLEHVRIVYGDTRVIPFAIAGTAGSRAAMLATGAVMHATRSLKNKVLAVVAGMLEVAPEELEIEDGVVTPRDRSATGVTLDQVAMTCHFISPPADGEPSLRSEAVFAGVGRGGWSGGTSICVVEVDRETGAIEILRYVVVEDCGKIINPAIVDGQIRGGVAQGIGIALLEDAHYDEEGNFLAGTLMDYLLPTAESVPQIEIEHLDSEPLGEVDFRGVGEGGAVVAPAAVVNAVSDALGGIAIEQLPLTPERVWSLIKRRRTS